MTVMNNSARVAFARSVLWSEVNWSKQYECGDGDNLIYKEKVKEENL